VFRKRLIGCRTSKLFKALPIDILYLLKIPSWAITHVLTVFLKEQLNSAKDIYWQTSVLIAIYITSSGRKGVEIERGE
jgi:hypothetical protein